MTQEHLTGQVSRQAVLDLLEGALDGELTGAGAEAIRSCWRLVRDMPTTPHTSQEER